MSGLILVLFVCAENTFDEISRRNSWPANTMTAVPKGMTTTKKNIGSYESSERDEFFHTKEYWFSKKKKNRK